MTPNDRATGAIDTREQPDEGKYLIKDASDRGRSSRVPRPESARNSRGKSQRRGINVVLLARRDALLAELGRAISEEFDVQYRALANRPFRPLALPPPPMLPHCLRMEFL